MQSVFQPYQLQAIRAIINMLRERTGSGVPSGLQNQREGLTASQVGSIPTLPRHNKEIANSLLKSIHPDNPLKTKQETANSPSRFGKGLFFKGKPLYQRSKFLTGLIFFQPLNEDFFTPSLDVLQFFRRPGIEAGTRFSSKSSRIDALL